MSDLEPLTVDLPLMSFAANKAAALIAALNAKIVSLSFLSDLPFFAFLTISNTAPSLSAFLTKSSPLSVSFFTLSMKLL